MLHGSDGDSGLVVDQGREPRFLLRIANWLHYNRGKRAWTYVADVYAVMLLYLAISGIFMIKGKLGLRWRGATLIAIGLLAPVGYIVLSGGPGAQKTERVAARPGEVDPPKPDAPPPRPNDGIRPLPPDPPQK